MHQPVSRRPLGRQPKVLSQLLRPSNSLAKPLQIDRRDAITGQDAHRNGRIRRVETPPKQVSPRIEYLDFVSGQRPALDPVHRLGINPRMARPDGLHVTLLQHYGRHGQTILADSSGRIGSLLLTVTQPPTALAPRDVNRTSQSLVAPQLLTCSSCASACQPARLNMPPGIWHPHC